MDRNKKILTVVLVLVVIAAGLILFFTQNGSDSESKATPVPKATPKQAATAKATAASQAKAESTIRFTSSGFSPATLTVAVGTTVTIQNDSDRTVDFSSDPHPTHTLYPFLNAGDIAPGESATVTIPRAGSFGYHDHLDPSMKGTIVAQ
jgi:plastocyanin